MDAEKQRLMRKTIRDKAISTLGTSCICGVTDPEMICIDHVNDDGRKDRATIKSSVTLYRKIISGKEINRYQLLCFNCNLSKEIDRQSKFILTHSEKFCLTCQMSVDLGNFKKDVKYSDGYYYECRSCSRSRVMLLKMEAILLIGDPRCILCNHKDIKSLTFDHIHEDGGTLRGVEGLGETLYRNVIRGVVDPTRLQILCLNCNIKKNINLKGARRFLTGHIEADVPIAPAPKKKLPSVESHELGDFNFEEVNFEFTSGPDSVKIPFAFFNTFHYAQYGRFGSGHVIARLRDVVIAVSKFASPIRLSVTSSLGLEYSKVLELDRFCIYPGAQKKNLASFVLARASRMIFNHFPNIEALVSFADPEQGHSGIIYKASGWEEVESKSRGYEYVDNYGQTIHKKTIWNQARSRNLTENEYSEQIGITRRYTVKKRKFVLRRR
jgi:5-methylcytosine-specific restriction endonuclease McrA